MFRTVPAGQKYKAVRQENGPDDFAFFLWIAVFSRSMILFHQVGALSMNGLSGRPCGAFAARICMRPPKTDKAVRGG
jgi:hypothetical protein